MNFGQPIKLVLADAQPLFRRGVMALLAREATLDVAGEAGTAQELAELCERVQPQLVLLDMRLPPGLDEGLLARLGAAPGPVRFVALTDDASPHSIAAAFSLGMHGYLLKSIDAPELVHALHRCWAGETVLSPVITRQLVEGLRASEQPGATAHVAGITDRPSLSPREREVLRELAVGASNKEIARRLCIAETTVKIHISHLMHKLELRSRVQLAVWASTQGADSVD